MFAELLDDELVELPRAICEANPNRKLFRWKASFAEGYGVPREKGEALGKVMGDRLWVKRSGAGSGHRIHNRFRT
jgi:hypothetical protein